MSSMILSGDTSGAITVTVPAVAGTNTITLPAATGTVLVSGNQPAFSAYAGLGTSLSNNTFTKILFDTEEYDTNNNYDSSRFTPTIAGYYQLSAGFGYGGSGGTNSPCYIYKNGSPYRVFGNGQGGYGGATGLVYMNGTTDYAEIYVYQNSGGTITTGTSTQCFFSGVLVRTA